MHPIRVPWTALTEDAVWLQHLAEVPALRLPEAPLLVVVPHPDDETLGAGGLIASLRRRGSAVMMVAVTDGENAYETPAAGRAALRETREREQWEALACLGVNSTDIHRLRLTDSGLGAELPALTEQLAALVQPGMVLLAPWEGDFHPDHKACAQAAQAAAERTGAQLLSYFFWTWHRGHPELLEGLPLRRFALEAEAFEAKQRALAMHRSQLQQEDGQPILPERLLAPARWPFEVFLPR